MATELIARSEPVTVAGRRDPDGVPLRIVPRLRRRLPWLGGTVAGVVVLLGTLPGLTAVLDGPPAVIMTVLGAAVTLGVAVPLAVRIPPLALLLVAAVVLGFDRLVPAALADGPLGGIEVVGLLVLSWSAGQLGLRNRLTVGIPVLVGWLLLVIIGLDFDAPLTMLAVGWWLIGTIARSRSRLRQRLAVRVAELASERDHYAAEAVRLERARVARDLHDIVAHCMTVVVIQARAGRQLLEDDPALVAETWAAITATVAEADGDLDALTGLTEPDPERPLTEATLESLVGRAERSGSAVTTVVHGRPDDLPRPVGVLAQRAVQESLTNALRYAPGAPITIELDCRGGLRIAVTNRAPSSPVLAGLGSGRGLAGLRERLDGSGLGLAAGPDERGGWRVTVGPAPIEQAR